MHDQPGRHGEMDAVGVLDGTAGSLSASESAAELDGQYRRLVELSPDAVLLCSEVGEIRYANLGGLEMLGLDRPTDMVGQSIDTIVHPDSRRRVRAVLDGHRPDPGGHLFVEERFLRADGSVIQVELTAFPFVLEGEFVTHLVVRDITRRKQAEAAARRLRRRAVIGGSLAALALIAAAAYHGYRYSESAGFCGGPCHVVMEPESSLHQLSSHAHVSCAGCHIGDGASWYVKSKLAGVRQVYAVLADRYSKPIPAPIVNLRPAPETCEHCHSSRVFHGDRPKVFRSVGSGGPRDPELTSVTLHVGGLQPSTGKFVGIHWHAGADETVEYRAADAARLAILDVRVNHADGTVTTFEPASEVPVSSGAPWRKMDCCDCHNRVAHRYQEPEQAVDALLLSSNTALTLPDLKVAALDAIGARFESRAAAATGIPARLASFYDRTHPGLSAAERHELGRVADRLLREAWMPNVIPRLHIGWNTYPDHAGHRGSGGCFRCHDGAHISRDGRRISQECDLCHEILAHGQRQSQLAGTARELAPSK